MDKAKKVCKYQLETFVKPVAIYYSIFIAVIIFLSVIANKSGGNFSSSGLEFSTWIFVFVSALNSFKGPFYFAQANNVSRKSFFKGTFLYALVVSLVLPVIDIIINRVYNLFVESPMNYDMIYRNIGGLSNAGTVRKIEGLNNVMNYSVDNSLGALVENYLFLVAALMVVFALGLLINTILFRLNRVGKYVASGIVATLVMISGFIPQSFWIKIGEFCSKVFGYDSQNAYLGVMTLLIIAVIGFGVQYTLVRKAEPTK